MAQILQKLFARAPSKDQGTKPVDEKGKEEPSVILNHEVKFFSEFDYYVTMPIFHTNAHLKHTMPQGQQIKFKVTNGQPQSGQEQQLQEFFAQIQKTFGRSGVKVKENADPVDPVSVAMKN